MTNLLTLERSIFLAGIGQLALALGSIYIPYALRWKEDLSKVRPLIRQIFWTYAGYIFCINLSFGIVSVIGAKWLIDRSPLATAVTLFITLYWAARIMIQFTYFDRKDAPKGLIFTLGESVLVFLFIFFTSVYGYAAVFNLWGTEP